MAALTSIAVAAGIGLGVAGAATSISGASEANQAQQAILAAEAKAEKVRQEAMLNDADRRRRQMIRQGIIQRSQALSTATNQGANESSALPGAFGQIQGNTSFAVSGVNEQVNFGTQLFKANQELLAAKSQLANAQETSSIGSSISSLGGSLISNAGTIGKLFN